MDIQKFFDCLSESEQADLLQFSVMRLQKIVGTGTLSAVLMTLDLMLVIICNYLNWKNNINK